MNNLITSISSIEPMKFGYDVKEATSEQNSAEIPFSSILSDVIQQTTELQAVSEADTNALLLGDTDNLAQVQINSMKAEAMLQTTVQLTTRAVNAYKEIMSMQI